MKVLFSSLRGFLFSNNEFPLGAHAFKSLLCKQGIHYLSMNSGGIFSPFNLVRFYKNKMKSPYFPVQNAGIVPVILRLWVPDF